MKIKKMVSIVLTAIIASLTAVPSLAFDTHSQNNNETLTSRIINTENEVLQNNDFNEYITNISQKNNRSTTNQPSAEANFDNFNIKIDTENLNNSQKELLNNMSNNELYIYIQDLYHEAYSAYNDFINSDNEVKASASSDTGIARASATRNGDVWAGVPLIGHGYIRIRYNVSYNNGRFTSAEYLDSWFTGGIAVGSYDARYGDQKIVSNNSVAEIYATGTLTYGVEIKGLPTYISVDATFLFFDRNPY